MSLILPLLPIDDVIPELLQHMHERSCVVLVAEPGAGKSTRVPVAIQTHFQFSKILVLQPRRVAARALAEWIATEQRWQLGREVGYHVRFERRASEQTQIEIITEGILLQRILHDPELNGIDCVVLDEFHERSLHLDLSLALLKEIVATLRPQLKVIVMSATLDAQSLLRYWPDGALVQSRGREFPVQVLYSQKPISLGGGPALIDRILATVLEAVEADGQSAPSASRSGHILIFLPGVGEIRQATQKLLNYSRLKEFEICALHSQMTLTEQVAVLRNDRRRKIIFSTNIAETSLTVDGVTAVIDSGLIRMTHFDRRTGVESLDLERASRASQTQRQGRAGRQSAGRCFKLWSKTDDLSTPAQTVPEVLRADLAEAVLFLAAWGVRVPEKFDWFEPPQMADLQERHRFLKRWDF